jgi:hypothetical protein
MFPRLHLSEATIERLARMLAAWEAGEVQGRSDSREEPQEGASSVYLARTPDSGIPGLETDESLGTGSFDTGADTGTGTAQFLDDGTGTGVFDSGAVHPGSALCTVYVLNRSDETLSRGPVKSELVYNFGPRIAGNLWVLIVKDRLGVWWAVNTPKPTLRGKLNTTLVYRGTATMRVWELIDGVETDTGEDVLVRSWCLSSVEFISAGKEVTVHWDESAGCYYVGSAECES